MKHPAGAELPGRCHYRTAHGAATGKQLRGLLQNLGPAGLVNSRIHAAAHGQLTVRRIDDGIHLLLRNVTLHQLQLTQSQFHKHDFAPA